LRGNLSDKSIVFPKNLFPPGEGQTYEIVKKTYMKKIICMVLLASVIGFSAFIVLANWKVKEPYEVKFYGKIHGEFKGLKANIQFDKDHPEDSKISASIEVSTIATGFFLKNDHVQNALDAEKYPTISFSSSSVSKSGSAYDAVGKLTIKGVTKPATIHFTFEDKGSGGVFKGGFKIIPKEYSITHDGTPDELTISLTVPATR
jgi:polyisoprenoid-binding protein YceI